MSDDIDSIIVERTIEPVEFSEMVVGEWQEDIRAEMAREKGYVDDEEVQRRLIEKVKEVATQQTLNKQGHHRLHNDIDHGLVIGIDGTGHHILEDPNDE